MTKDLAAFQAEVEQLTLNYDVHDLELLMRQLARKHAAYRLKAMEETPAFASWKTGYARECAEPQAVALLLATMTKAMGQKVVTVEQAVAWLKSKADAPVNDVS